MKRYILSITCLLICNICLYSQSLFAFGEKIDTIEFTSNQNHFLFDEKGSTKGLYEKLTISFDYMKNKYYISNYLKVKYLLQIRPAIKSIDSQIVKKHNGLRIDLDLLKNLVDALSDNRHPAQNLSIEAREDIVSKISRREVKRTGRRFGNDWFYKNRYSNRQDFINLVSACKSVDTFNIFLIENFDTTGYMIINDVSSTIDIFLRSNNHSFRYEGKYPNIYKQPWYSWSEDDHGLPRSILNFRINRLVAC